MQTTGRTASPGAWPDLLLLETGDTCRRTIRPAGNCGRRACLHVLRGAHLSSRHRRPGGRPFRTHATGPWMMSVSLPQAGRHRRQRSPSRPSSRRFSTRTAQIAEILEDEPEFARRAERAPEPERRVIGNCAPAVQCLRDAVGRHVDASRQFRRAHAERFEPEGCGKCPGALRRAQFGAGRFARRPKATTVFRVVA